jgi:phosphoglycolate phosphatase
MKEKKIFIFDLDGTLADAYKAIEKSLNYARLKFGLEKVSFRQVKINVGRGDEKFINTFFTKDIAKEALKIYRSNHKRSLALYSSLRPQALVLLKALKKRNKIIALASNRPSPFTRIILESNGILKYFDYVLCADEVKRLKPNPKILKVILGRFKLKPSFAVYIGDMAIDLETAKRAGIDAVFVAGGSSSYKEALRYRRVKAIRNLKSILNLYK